MPTRLLVLIYGVVNLAFALAMRQGRPRVGVLDLDVFGPSIPKLMGLDGDDLQEPLLTPGASALTSISCNEY